MKITNKERVKILKAARKEFIKDHYRFFGLIRKREMIKAGLCIYLSRAIDSKGICFKNIRQYIPGFNREFLGAKKGYWVNPNYWWDSRDIRSRVKALNKLIKYYRNEK